MTTSGKQRSKALVLAAALAACGGCSALDGSGCTTAGCLDGVGITVRTANGSWPAGSYSLTITDDESTHRCQMTLPEDLPARGSTSELACDPAIGVPGASLSQDATCTEQRTADAVSQSCTPIPDHYTVSVFIQRTPDALSVAVTRDGEPLAEVSEELEYVEHHPNGEDCEPTCRGAGVEVVLE